MRFKGMGMDGEDVYGESYERGFPCSWIETEDRGFVPVYSETLRQVADFDDWELD